MLIVGEHSGRILLKIEILRRTMEDLYLAKLTFIIKIRIVK